MGGLGRKFLHKLPDIEILRNLESPFILWIQIDIYFLASTNYVTSLDMAGCSFTLSLMDDEALSLWDAPVHTAALRWGC